MIPLTGLRAASLFTPRQRAVVLLLVDAYPAGVATVRLHNAVSDQPGSKSFSACRNALESARRKLVQVGWTMMGSRVRDEESAGGSYRLITLDEFRGTGIHGSGATHSRALSVDAPASFARANGEKR